MNTRRSGILGGILIFIGVTLFSAGYFTLIQPDEYEATVTISVSRPDPVNDYSYDPYFIQTEFEVIQSHAVLGRVTEKLSLKEVWGKKYNNGQPLTDDDVERIIKHSLEMHPVRNTKLIEIHVFRDNPSEVALLANAIAETYRDYRSETSLLLLQRGEESLKEQLRDTEAKVAAAQEQVDKLRADLKISDGTVSSNDPIVAPYFKARQQLDESRKFRDVIKAKLAEAAEPLPKPVPVSIINPASPPLHPVRPNRFLAAVLLGAGLLLIAGGVWWSRRVQGQVTPA
jgi:uncharacterized protein involved in exopolysaccharide biosynthesis